MRMDTTTVTQTAARANVICDPWWSLAMEAHAGNCKKSVSDSQEHRHREWKQFIIIDGIEKMRIPESSYNTSVPWKSLGAHVLLHHPRSF